MDNTVETLDGGNHRNFQGTTRATATDPAGTPINVYISGSQDRDGTIERYVVIDGTICLTVDAALALAADLQAATDEIETLGIAADQQVIPLTTYAGDSRSAAAVNDSPAAS
jgi:hypothetical protein